MLTHNPRWCLLASLVSVLGATAAGAAGPQLRPAQVLVVYDSRIADSRAVAEYYAGSEKVPGGTGGRPGARPGVQVVDLAQIGGAGLPTNPGNINYTTFISNFRDPLRGYLTSNEMVRSVRCIVLTKGIPHRIQDINHPNPNVGDQPTSAANLLNAGNVTYASVDSELTLLWHNLSVGETNGRADSRADGGLVNPYHRSLQPINAFSTSNIQTPKNVLAAGAPWGGLLWRTFPTGTSGMTGGDIYLVCRLDGHTVQDVYDSIDRAREVIFDSDKCLFLLDESGSDGVQNLSDTDNELDNDGPALTNYGDDYEQTRDLLLADARVMPANIVYNRWSTADQFIVGPRINFGGGVVIHGPLLLLATYGANHTGFPGAPGNAGTQYPFSFNYEPGAVFNTIESYNGRSFGGIGVGPTPQGQLADFIQAGGTFGIGNVWEPFSYSIPDNALIVRNFFLGSLTWAEAAYSSIPLLSWQQIVVGDPLARVRRNREDINGDDVNDVDDLYAWFAAASRPRDFNRDGRIDRIDIEILRDSLRGPEGANKRPDDR